MLELSERLAHRLLRTLEPPRVQAEDRLIQPWHAKLAGALGENRAMTPTSTCACSLLH
jgi:hypothetical protein